MYQLRHSASYFDPSRATADNAEGERSLLYKSRVLVNCFKSSEDVLFEAKRVVHCVERERMFVRARRVKEIHHRPQRHNEIVVTYNIKTVRHDFFPGQIDAPDHGLMEGNVFSAVQKLADRKTDFRGPQFVSRHLVE